MQTTPLIKIKYKYKNEMSHIYAKLEYCNPTGSMKDKTSNYMIQKAIEIGKLINGQPIVEATTGNTGIAIASIGAKIGSPVHIFIPDNVPIEIIKLIENYNANINKIPNTQGGIKRCIQESKVYAEKINAFFVNQFSNKDNIIACYKTTGEEIVRQIHEQVGGFTSVIGSGGTIMGVSKRLRRINPNIQVAAIISDINKYIPNLIDMNQIDKLILINYSDAVNMSRLISRKLGIGVGISSGANFLGAVILNNRVEGAVITIFVDDNKKYLSTQLAQNVDTNPNFLSNNIELISYE